jgi:hypothetical protein
MFFALIVFSLPATYAAEEHVDDNHYTHAIVFKTGAGEELTWLQLLRLGDNCIITNRATKPSTTRNISLEDFETLWKGIKDIQDFQTGAIIENAERLDLAQTYYVVTFQRSAATGRHESTHMFRIPRVGKSAEFQKWLATLERKRADQAGNEKPTTSPESKPEGGDKPQPESKVAPR